MDAANVDLKGFSESFYATVCGGRLEPVLETLEYLVRETKVWLEVTTLLIPGVNDSDAELDADDPLGRRAARARRAAPLHGLPPGLAAARPAAHAPRDPDARHGHRARERRSVTSTRATSTTSDGQSTYCHACGALLVERDWYRLGAWRLDDGRCARCGVPCAGVFEPSPGTWGARRLPVRLAA